MNGDMNGTMEDSMDASSQGPPYNTSESAPEVDLLRMDHHTDSSNQGENSNPGEASPVHGDDSNQAEGSNLPESSDHCESCSNDSVESQSQSPSESTDSTVRHPETCVNDKKNKPRRTQGIPISTTLDIYRRPSGEAQDSTSRDSDIDIDINIVITVKPGELRQRCNRTNNSNLKDSPNNDLQDSDNVPESSSSGQGTEVKRDTDQVKEECDVKPESDVNREANEEMDKDEIDTKEERQTSPGNSYNQQSSSNSASQKRSNTQEVCSGIPIKKISLPPQKSNSKMLRTTIKQTCNNLQGHGPEGSRQTEDTNMEVDSTTNLEDAEDSCDSISSNSNTPANTNNCTNSNDSTVESDSVASSNIKIKGDSSSDEESERDDRQDVHEIQSDSEDDDVRRVSSKQEDSEEMDTDDDSSEEDGSDGSEEGEIGNDEHVSINSDTEPEAIDDDSKDSQLLPSISNRADSGEVLLVDDASNQGDQKPATKAKIDPVVHEIVSDNEDCVLTPNCIDPEARRVLDMYPGIRDKLMDVTRRLMTNAKEMMTREGLLPNTVVEECLSKKAIIVNDTKELVDLAKNKGMDKQQLSEKKEPTVVIIDTDSNLSSKTSSPVPPKSPYSVIPVDSPAQALYQSIAARGTTVTPVCRAAGAAPILPSLTDDMFVVEAPSFIVPYVYEKPSIKPFREFVDVLGKELEEKRLKEEKEKFEKEKDKVDLRKEKTEDLASPPKQELHTKVDDGKIQDVDEEMSEESPRKKKSDKKGRKKPSNDDDDASWDGTSSSDSDDDVISDDEAPKTIIIKEKEDDSLDGIKDPTAADLTSDIKNSSKSDNYFDNSLGKFFINIGVNLVQEYVQSDLLKQQKRKLYKENRSGSGNIKSTEVAISSLTKNLEFSRDNNAPYKFRQKKCEYCSFKTESALAMAHHMETPHMKNNVYKCNFCAFEIRSPHDILYHMEAEHNTRGRLERAPAYHQCANCPFEDNGKGKLARHLIACAKKFKPDHNLIPPVEWEPPAKIPKMTRARHSMMNTYQAAFAKSTPAPAGLAALYRGRGRPTAPMPTLPTAPRPVPGAPLVRGGLVYRPSQQLVLPTNFQLLPGGQTTIKANNNMGPAVKSLQHQPSISITPLPRALPAAPPPLAPLPAGPPGKATFVICEICDGYIKDLDQLRNHMQWIHKVKIHPKMIYNRPPLNCQKCQFRFFTDQGLERHLLGSHGLVTSSMQEAANRGKDAGRCPACGRVYQWKLLNHVARDHNMTLKPAHLSYKCTVCTATFGMYKQFENHVYSAHSVVAKRVNEKSKSVSNNHTAGPSKASSMADSLLKPLKINDEITIIPQPAKSSKNSDKKD